MEPMLLGSHPAMDFLNTRYAPEGAAVEVIGDGRSFLDWLVRAGLVDDTAAARVDLRVSRERLDALAKEARNLRAWADRWITRWSHDPAGEYRPEVRRLNALLQRGRYRREVHAAHDGFHVIERARVEEPDDLLALVATQLALLVANEDPTRVKRCAGSDCTLWFVDRTKGRRRLFCSASACGNRAKVAAFRARQRASDG